VSKKRNKRKKITQAETLRKIFSRNERKRQPIEMVDRSSQSSKQPIKRLRCLRFSFTQLTHAMQALALRAFEWKPGFRSHHSVDEIGVTMHTRYRAVYY